MKKRLFSILLAFVLVFSMIHLTSFATDEDIVYFSISYDGQFIEGQDGKKISYSPISVSALSNINLADYGLEEFFYDGDGDNKYDITLLHLYIYIHEQILGLDWNDIMVSGGSGSIFFESGLFGFEDCNLNYYYNGSYPELYPGWGTTADCLSLSNGDFCDIAGYSSWSFWSDSATGFLYFADEDDNITHNYNTDANTPTDIKLVKSGGGFGGELNFNTIANYDVYYGTSLDNRVGTVTTDENGIATLPTLDAGTYVLWCDGGYGEENPMDIVSAPAYATLTVNQGASNPPVEKTPLEKAVEGTPLSIGVTSTNDNVVIVPTSKNNTALTQNELINILSDESITITANNGIIGTGCKISINEEETELVVMGDIDGDGIVNVFDALILKKALTNNTNLESIIEFAGDVDGNKELSESDIDKILSHIVGESYID